MNARAVSRVAGTASRGLARLVPPGWRREAALVLAMSALVQVLVFRGYYAGTAAPFGDFLGPYTSEAYAWWHSGGLLHPPDWMPQLWGGYPASASVQNSSWYLPVGLASLATLDVHAMAVLQALHVALGGLGLYVLARRARFGVGASLVGMVAYSLCSGFVVGAPYVDLVRGYALAPWVLLCLSPLWPWRRWWGTPAATLLLWQCAVGVYPGQVVALAYCGAVWLAAWLLLDRRRSLAALTPLALSAVSAALLTAPKYLPLVALKTFEPATAVDLSPPDAHAVASALLPAYPGMSGLLTFNSYFVPAVVLLCVGFARLDRAVTRASIAALVVAGALSAPWAWLTPVVDALPGLGSSRFRSNDLRVVVVVAVVLVGVCGLDGLLTRVLTRRRAALGLAVPVVSVGLAIAALGHGFARGDWLPTFTVLCVSAVVLTAAVAAGAFARRLPPAVPAVAIAAALALASGAAHAASQSTIWAADTRTAQRALWGVTSDELIAAAPPEEAVGDRRPPRTGPPLGTAPDALISPAYNTPYYTGVPGFGGYLNVHQSAAYVGVRLALTDPATAAATHALLEAGGTVVADDAGLPSPATVAACARGGACGPVTSVPVSYSPGRLTYDVTADRAARVVANEAYYLGWRAWLTDDTGHVREITTSLGPAGFVQMTLPPGRWRLDLRYTAPYHDAAVLLAWAGVVLALLTAVVAAVRARRRRDGA